MRPTRIIAAINSRFSPCANGSGFVAVDIGGLRAGQDRHQTGSWKRTREHSRCSVPSASIYALPSCAPRRYRRNAQSAAIDPLKFSTDISVADLHGRPLIFVAEKPHTNGPVRRVPMAKLT